MASPLFRKRNADNDKMNSKENEDKFDRVRQNFKAKPPPITQPKPSARKIQVKPMIPPSERDRSPVGSAVNGKKNVTSDDEMAVTDEDLKLNSDSLAQFARVDLDAVKRYAILDTSAQKQKAYLGHGKGLKDRRLPANIASMVGDDYYDKRKSYDPSFLLETTPQESRARSRTHDVLEDTPPVLSEEEKQKQIMAKMGVPQGGAISGLAQLLKKSSSKLSRSASSGSKDHDSPPQVKVKPKKASVISSPDLSRVRLDSNKSKGSIPSPRSSFKLFKKRKGRSSREGSLDDISRGSIEDLYSETSSLNSMSRMSIREEDTFESDAFSPVPPTVTPIKPTPTIITTSETSPVKTSPTIDKSTPIKMTQSSVKPTRGESILKEDMPQLFNDKSDTLFDSELNDLLSKTQTLKSLPDKPEEVKPPKEEKKIEPVEDKEQKDKELQRERDMSGGLGAPQKPMRKSKSRASKVDISAYDRAAAEAIKKVKEREEERTKEKEIISEKKSKQERERLALFDETVEDKDDLFADDKKDKIKEERTQQKSKATSLFDDDLFADEKPIKEKTTPLTTPPSSALFGEPIDLSVEKEQETKKKDSNKISLFDEDDEDTTTKDDKVTKKEDIISKPTIVDSSDTGDDKSSKIASEKGISQSSPIHKSPPPVTPTKELNPVQKVSPSVSPLTSPTHKVPPKTTAKPPTAAKPVKKISTTPSTTPISPSKSKEIEKKTEAVEEEMPAWKKRLEERRKQRDEEKKKSTSDISNENEGNNDDGVPAWKKRLEERRKQKALEEEEKKKDVDVKKDEKEIKKDEKELKKDEKEIKKDEKEIKKDEKEIKKDEKEIKKDEKEIKKDEKEIKKDEKEIKKDEKEIKKDEKEVKKDDEKELKKNDKEVKVEKETKEDDKEEVKREEKEMKKDDKITKSNDTESAPSPAVAVKEDNDEDVPAWKKRLEERRKQRELEGDKKVMTDKVTKKESSDEEMPAWKKRLEERRRQKEKDTTERPSLAPIETENKSEIKTVAKKEDKLSINDAIPLSPSVKEGSPTTPIDPTLPKWKQDLLLRKRSATNAPPSPLRKAMADDKKEDNVPSWKKDLLAARKKDEGRSVSGRDNKEKEVPSFMQEFQKKKRDKNDSTS